MLEGNFTTLDWSIVAVYFVVVIILGLVLTKRASASVEQFFVSGRGLPWYLAGISISATSLASDTPLWVTDMTRTLGIQAMWYEWAPAWGMVISMFITARLLRRSRLVTDAELAVVRYGGPSAKALRVFSSAFYSIFLASIILGWVLSAMGTWGEEVLGVDRAVAIIVAASVAAVYSIMSGLWGVVLTDFFQFIVATGGTIVLAVLAVQHVGGIDSMAAQLHALEQWRGNDLTIIPRPDNIGLWLILAYFGLQWISGANPMLYSAQRVLACRTEKDASLALLANVILRHALNIWPWVITALCSLIIFPDITNHQSAYPAMVVKLLPAGLRGLMIAAILAAFMSTVDTLFNWGTSYIVNDVYRPYIHRNASERHYVTVSRLWTFLMAVCGCVLGLQFTNVLDHLQFAGGMLICFAPVMVLRWFWWRINAWSELSAIAAAAVVSLGVDLLLPQWSGAEFFGHRVITSIAIVTAVWLLVTFLTKPSPMSSLEAFYRRVRPLGLWGPVRAGIDSESLPPRTLPSAGVLLSACLATVTLLYGSVLTVGKFALGYWTEALIGLVIIAVAASYVFRVLNQIEEPAPSAAPVKE